MDQQKPKELHAELIVVARRYRTPVNPKDTVIELAERVLRHAIQGGSLPLGDQHGWREVWGITLTAEIDWADREKLLMSDLLKAELNE